jgi:hypothetical protein
MFILEILLGLKSKQGDVICAFLHVDLEPGENGYVEIPLGFTQYSKNGIQKILRWRRPFTDFDRVPGLSGNILLKSLNHVDWNNPNLTHVYLL